MSFWKSKEVVVTGGYGFLGSAIIDELQKQGADSIRRFRSQEYNLLSLSETKKALKDANIVIHCAARAGGIGYNQANPGMLFYENAQIGLNVIETSRLLNINKLVLIGTICAYPKIVPIPFKESDIWNGYPEETNAPYGLAKKMMLVHSQAYKQEYGLNSIYIMPTNLYGERDNFNDASSHVIPAMIKKLCHAQTEKIPMVTLWGDGSPTRDFLYVKDAAKGIVQAAELYNQPLPINIGSGQEVAMSQLAEIIKQQVGYKGKIHWDTTKPNGQPRRCLDITNAQKYFGFQPMTPLDEGLRNTIEWYKTAVRNK